MSRREHHKKGGEIKYARHDKPKKDYESQQIHQNRNKQISLQIFILHINFCAFQLG
jgi:hypothetical protein